MMTLAMAADAAGVAKTTVWRAIKSGRITATKDADGTWHVDPAEINRAFPPTPPQQHSNGTLQQDSLEREIALLREMYEEMKQQRDHWHETAQQALRALPWIAPAAAPTPGHTVPEAPAPKSWWAWLRSAG
jgi:hypothetical protein